MDEPGLDADLHAEALAGLRRINLASQSDLLFWPSVARLCELPRRGPVRVLDVGCGGGDVAFGLARRAVKAGFDIQIDGCDNSDFAIDYAKSYGAHEQVQNVRFFRHDILAGPIPDEYDVVMCSLFLHHFDEDDAVQILGRMNDAARHLVLVQDLRRSWLGYWMAWLGCRFLSRSPVVHADGPLSVQGAFREDEVLALAVQAKWPTPTIKKCWPERFLMTASVG
jgi:2-polyprenyl-3-methyl-5-hydroxy-6-metoxy-1,4-benzoquinol methylase